MNRSPLLIAMAGLPGTGKSTLAQALAQALDAAVIDKDRVRAALFEPRDIAYERTQDDVCFRAMLDAALYLLRPAAPAAPTSDTANTATPGRAAVVLDGRTFSRRDQVEAAQRFATEHGLDLRLVECVASEETVRARLVADAVAGTHPAANRDFELYRRLARAADEIVAEKRVVCTDRGSLDPHVAELCAWLSSAR